MSDYSAASNFCFMLLARRRTRREHPPASDNRPQNHLNKKRVKAHSGGIQLRILPRKRSLFKGRKKFQIFKRALPHPHHPLSRNSGSDIMRWSLSSSPNPQMAIHWVQNWIPLWGVKIQHATFAFTSPPASPAPRGLWSHRENWLRQLRHCKLSELSAFSALINLLEVESRLSTLW